MQTDNTLQNYSPKILVIGYQEFSHLVSSSLDEFQDVAQFKIVNTILGSSTDVYKHFDDYKPDVVISAGANSAYLKSILKIPVLSLEVTESDVILAISKAAKITNDILLICFKKPKSILPHLEKSLGVNITCESYETPEEAREQFYLSTNKSPRVVVGASFICGLATAEGLKSFLYYSRESCRNIIKKAIEVGTEFAQNKNNNAVNQWLLTQSQSPTILINEIDGSVILNSSAKQHFNFEDINSHDLQELLLESQISGINCHSQHLWKFSRDIINLKGCDELIVYQFFKVSQELISATTSVQVTDKLIYTSELMSRMMSKVQRFSASSSNVLIYGESGTGKELIARTIHQSSPYAQGNFVAINCGAIPADLFEGELFGYVDGAYTGSKRGGRKGLVESAAKGVLFLDEVSELTLEQQTKLLRFIQERTIRPLGGNKELSIDLKIVAASNVPLATMVAEKTFREDLFYRLNVFSLELPPLCLRKSDIEAIALAKLELFFNRYQLTLKAELILSTILPTLNNYSWPGNIRELENVIERLVVHLMVDNEQQNLAEVMREVAPELYSNLPTTSGNIKQTELLMVADAMTKFSNNKQQAANYLGMSTTTFWRRLKQLER